MADEQTPDNLDTRVGSADVSADDEKKKYIAQAGSNPLAQERAQDVPQPQSNEAKDLQNELAEAEHQAKGAATEDEKEGRLNAAANREDLGDYTRRKTDDAQRQAGNA